MKRIRILAFILSMCFVSVAWGQKVKCPASVNWTEFHTIDMMRWNPCEKVLNVNNVGSLSLKWSYTTGGGVYSSPAVANGVVYVGSEDNNVYALNAKTGALLWNYTTGNSIDSSPAVANGVVYVGGGNDVYALNASSGALLWSYATNGAVESSPAVVNGVVYVGSDDGNLYAFGLKKGRK
jgi:outer membrane protein assembly factor BamB